MMEQESTLLNILVIDDDKGDRMICQKALESAFGDNLRVMEAEDGESGLKAIEKQLPHCVLLDHRMPGIDGIEVLKRIRIKQPHLPVVMINGKGNDVVAVQSMKEGAQDYIAKSSITPPILQRIVQMAIEHCALRKCAEEDRREGEKIRDQLRHAQKMEALGQLTGGIAHDFNNLLAIVLGNLDFMIEGTKEGDPLREFIKPSIEAVEHGAELTKQLLAFGRKQALLPKVISLNELLHYFTTLVRHTLGERIEVILALEPELWNINVDPSQLQNALLNLAVNARDAMPGGGKLIFETKNVSLDEEYAEHNADVVPGDYVVVATSDTGEGMTREVIEKAFEPFFTTKDVGQGSGLGLSMVYGFVKQSNGNIKLYSEPGHGTSIKIYLPRAEGAVLTIEQAKVKPPSTGKKAARVLVVEDNKEILKLTSSMVESLGYSALQAETGDAALKILQAHSDIALLLTDVMLPGSINGPELAKRAVALNPNLKVLFNSGYAENAILQSGMLEADVHIISKPFRKQQLAHKIEEVLKQ